jgi:cytochrome c2
MTPGRLLARVLAAAGLGAAGVGAATAWAAGPEAATARLAGDPAAGETLFQDRCAMCHVAEGGGQGPSLTGVYGRKAGSGPDFAYSAALKGSGLTWTASALDHFLADPGAAVPGTAMPIRITDAKARADLISYIERDR